MTKLSVGRVLVTLVACWAAFGSYVFDWNATHIFNPAWPSHAKFHNAQTMLLGSTIGLFAIALLWKVRGDAQTLLRIAAVLASLYWITQMGALAFPGTALVDPDLARPGEPPAQLIVDAVMLTLLGIGSGLEARRLKGGNAVRSGTRT
jgi:hypothetical protein